ncbi:MAG: FGGY family carbohydrate kinase [Ancrocorticia sp.]
MTNHILVLDEGTTSTRAVLFNDKSEVVDEESLPIAIHTPQFGHVEHDAQEIIDASVKVLRAVIERAASAGQVIDCLAITNQRTATTVMERATGRALTPTISWQDARAALRSEALTESMGAEYFRTTGMNLAAANVGLHVEELFKDEELKARSGTGELLIGTPDVLMVKALTGNDYISAANASCTGILNQHTGTWYNEFLELCGLSEKDLPTVLPEDGDYGLTLKEVLGVELPVAAVVPDQQSALFGHGGLAEGSVKCTHGTGSFIDFNIGDKLLSESEGVDGRYGWRISSGAVNIVEGSTWVSGSAVEWMIDDLKILSSARELDEKCAQSTNPECIVVPALAGFAAPYWDGESRGTIFGLSRHTSDADIVRACIEGVAHTVVDLLEVISESTGASVSSLAVDGGLSKSDYLQQVTADLLGARVERTKDAGYVTARGAAWIAGIRRGIWSSPEDAMTTLGIDKSFEPQISTQERAARREGWKDAVGRSLNWKPRVLA